MTEKTDRSLQIKMSCRKRPNSECPQAAYFRSDAPKRHRTFEWTHFFYYTLYHDILFLSTPGKKFHSGL